MRKTAYGLLVLCCFLPAVVSAAEPTSCDLKPEWRIYAGGDKKNSHSFVIGEFVQNTNMWVRKTSGGGPNVTVIELQVTRADGSKVVFDLRDQSDRIAAGTQFVIVLETDGQQRNAMGCFDLLR